METLSAVLKAVWLYLAGIISVVALYFLLIGIGQGIDVVLQAGEYFVGPGFFVLVSVVLWSSLLWYSGRALSYIKQQQASYRNETQIATFLHKHFPRSISFNCYVCIQAAIISLPSTYDLNGYQLALFIIFHNALYFLITKWFEKIDKKYRTISIVCLVVYLAVMIYLLVTAYIHIGTYEVKVRDHRFRLNLLLLLLFIMECAWIYLLVWRRIQIDKTEIPADFIGDDLLSRIMRKVGIRKRFIFAERSYFKLFMLVSTVALLVYLTGIFYITVAVYIGTLAFVLLAMGILVCMTNFISFFSIRYSINFFFLLIIWSVLWGIADDPYKIRTKETKNDFSYSDRPDTNAYLEKWFDRRLTIMEKDSAYKDTITKFDIYIVLSNGGASRAGYWASSALSSIQDISYRKNPKNSFKEHLLCIAGASGGSVGNAAFYSLLKADHDEKIKSDSFTSYNDSFFRKDFLVFPIARLLSTDLFRHLIPFLPFDNRGDALERSLSESMMESGDDKAHDIVLKEYFDKPLSEVFDTSGDLPIFYMNTTEVDNGQPAVISSVKLYSEEFKSQRIDLLDSIDDMKKSQANKRLDLRLSTAAVLSSRFPYVSPAAKVNKRYYVDGGYFDNSGSGVIFEFAEQLSTFLKKKQDAVSTARDKKEAKRVAALYRRFTIHMLHFNNSENYKDPVKDINPVTNDIAAPFLTLVGIQGSSTKTSNGVLNEYFANQFEIKKLDGKAHRSDTIAVEYSLYKALDSIPVKEEIYPMSWVLSEYQMTRMNNALVLENRKNLRKLYFLNLP